MPGTELRRTNLGVHSPLAARPRLAHAYYSERLAGERLRLAYELASPRVRRYLAAEIDHVVAHIPADGRVLELGCGYGRVMRRLAERAAAVFGIDTSVESLELATHILRPQGNALVAAMDAIRLGLRPDFDVVCCVQNGISAFHVDRRELIESAVRVARPGGRVLVSTYADAFWLHRLEWFRAQAAHGLIGEIDEAATGDGVIVCKDGFTAATVAPDELVRLAAGLGSAVAVRVVDGSSVFCEITV
jgi:SAM-dependent methyltransferase